MEGGVLSPANSGRRPQSASPGGGGPAGVVQADGRGGGILMAFHLFHALTGFQSLNLSLDAHLSELLLDELDHLLAGGVVVSGPQRRLETIGISGFGKQFLSLLGVVRPRTKLDGIVDALRAAGLPEGKA